jgi:hypothetical protein
MVEPKKYPVNDFMPDIPKIFLEVDVFDHNLEKGNEILASFGVGASFEGFGETEQIVEVRPIGKKIRVVPTRESGRKCQFPPNITSPIICHKKRPHCDLSCRTISPDSPNSPGCIKIQIKRKYVATSYDDGERAWKKEEKVENKKGEWPEKVFIDQDSEPRPTEEILAQILYYTKSEETKFNEEKKKKTTPLLNKIMILHKDNEIEYVVDRFVSI